MLRLTLSLFAVASLTLGAQGSSSIKVEADMSRRASLLHHSLLTVDTHCDAIGYQGWDIGARHASGTALGGDQDLPRMKEGGLAASFFAVFTPQGPRTPEGVTKARQQADEALDRLDAMFRTQPDLAEQALTPDDAERIHRSGKRAIFLAMENGYPLGMDLDLVDHIDHIVKVAGVGHVGIGTDFNGGGGLLDCQDVSALPVMTRELMRRGYSKGDIRKIWGGNVLRVFRRVVTSASPRT